ncbi:MAG: beta-galactosidase [Bacillota bacterium]
MEPFFGISGEFRFSRCYEWQWEDEIIKMKMSGINIVSTYIFWNHHEEEQGIFEWDGNKNLRRFIELCGKHGLYAIIRIGTFCHGECRNGGLPDWLFGRPFEVRSNDEEYLFYVSRFYTEIGKQVKGLLYKDGGPVIAAQIENEFMHSAAPWEMTTGISNEWVPVGKEGDLHMKKLKSLANKAGIETPIYTCTAWGGAAAPEDEMLPLWGGYAFWPWIFYGDVKEHPVTPEFIFRDYHNSTKPKCYNFEPKYDPGSYPYACCEMGGSMNAGLEDVKFSIFPDDEARCINGAEVANKSRDGIFTTYDLKLPGAGNDINIKMVKNNKAIINASEKLFSGAKEVLLKVDYRGDVGCAFIDGELIHDNFCNGAPWEIGLKRFEKEIIEKGMYIYISPLKTGSAVKSDSAMAARMEISNEEIAEISSIAAVQVREVVIS